MEKEINVCAAVQVTESPRIGSSEVPSLVPGILANFINDEKLFCASFIQEYFPDLPICAGLQRINPR